MNETSENKQWFAGDVATFGDRLAGAREAAGLSDEDLARRLGVRLGTLRAWEEDTAEPRANRLQMLAGMLNVSIRWLLTGEGDGIEAPVAASVMGGPAREALADLARMRAQMLAMSQEMGQMEKRLRQLMRANGSGDQE
jgi:HTH-type transcriptional regulator, cell division transcriptional repressor